MRPRSGILVTVLVESLNFSQDLKSRRNVLFGNILNYPLKIKLGRRGPFNAEIFWLGACFLRCVSSFSA